MNTVLGLLVEPALNNYLNCVRNRSENTAVALAACVPLDFKDEVVWLGYADLMTTPMTLQSDLPALLSAPPCRQELATGTRSSAG